MIDLKYDRGELVVPLDERDLRIASLPELAVYDSAIVGEDGPPRLTWIMTVEDSSGNILNREVLIDAHTTDLVFHHSFIYSAVKNRKIYDAHWDEDQDPPDTLERAEGEGETGDDVIDAAYDNAGRIYDYYQSHHSWDGWDDENHDVDVRAKYNSTTWENAQFSDADGQIQLGCCGWGKADDVMGHEFTHGVTRTLSNLLYLNESGAINEALSDVWGEFLDQEELRADEDEDSDGFDDNPWQIFEDLDAPEGSGELRDMSNPTRFSWDPTDETRTFVHPDRYRHPDFYRGSNDFGGVHRNSGVLNKLAYLLVEGTELEPGGIFNGYDLNALSGQSTSRDLAADLLFECQAKLLLAGSDYLFLGFALRQAVINLTWNKTEESKVRDACAAVEICGDPAFVMMPAKNADGSLDWSIHFRSNGDLFLSGVNGIVQNAREGTCGYSDNLCPQSDEAEFVVKHGSEVIARVGKAIISDTLAFFIKGELHEDCGNPSNQDCSESDLDPEAGGELSIRAGSTIIAKLDQNGNLWVRGKVY